MILYGIRNCDTVRKARAWLDARGVAYAFHDYKIAGIDEPRLRAWVGELGWEKLLNRAGTTFRKLPEADKARAGRGQGDRADAGPAVDDQAADARSRRPPPARLRCGRLGGSACLSAQNRRAGRRMKRRTPAPRPFWPSPFALLARSAPQAAAERVLRTRVVTATFIGWERGDYLWARLDDAAGAAGSARCPATTRSARSSRRAGPARSRVWHRHGARHPARGRHGSRSSGSSAPATSGVTAEQWWNRLSPAHRRAWLRRYHEAIG